MKIEFLANYIVNMSSEEADSTSESGGESGGEIVPAKTVREQQTQVTVTTTRRYEASDETTGDESADTEYDSDGEPIARNRIQRYCKYSCQECGIEFVAEDSGNTYSLGCVRCHGKFVNRRRVKETSTICKYCLKCEQPGHLSKFCNMQPADTMTSAAPTPCVIF